MEWANPITTEIRDKSDLHQEASFYAKIIAAYSDSLTTAQLLLEMLARPSVKQK